MMATKKKGAKKRKRRKSKFPGIVYLSHFDEPYLGKQHYLGYAKTPHTLTQRIWHHRHGSGARFMKAITEAGIEFSIVRTWKGTRMLERVLKERKEAPNLCPECSERRGHKPAPANYTPEQLQAAYARYQARLVRRIIKTLEERERARMERLLEREGAEHAIKSVSQLR
jgi:predicted GIY-YIG superfamily endonuclease